MNKAWRVVLIIVVVGLILGGVCVGVGMITGADFDRIHAVFNDRYSIDMYWQYGKDVIAAFQEAF